MSDFDEEAERERLREKYEQDQQDRQATEKMSELLLQGATMTNAHCSDCGDPVFRYEGQEFCATCEKAIDRGDGAGAADGEEEDGDPGDASDAGAAGESGDGTVGTDGDGDVPDDEHIQVASPDETPVQFGGSAGAETARPESPSQPDRTPDEPAPERVPSVDPSPAAGTGAGSPDSDAGRPEPRDGPLPEARASLERTLGRLTRQAEAAEDPTQAREYLAAAREAAETLAALRQ